jgi:hypothetical protein
MSLMGWKRVLPKVRYLAVHCHAVQRSFLTFGTVPIADSHDLEDRSLVAVVRNAKAVTQITVSRSLTWPDHEPRLRIFK